MITAINHTMQIIWYNPDLDCYQKGSQLEFEVCRAQSNDPDRYDVLYEFNDTTLRLVDKILDSLNAVRESEVVS